MKESLIWLKQHSAIFKDIARGIEREALRISPQAKLAQTPFPKTIGSALTHPWITTDFAESMLEFITPVNTDIAYVLAFLRDLHRYASVQIGNELMWPLSIPHFITNEDEIALAQYGTSNEGKLKTVYRQGLKNRYGAMMQSISGVHYNFSLPLAFWQTRYNFYDENKQIVSDGYFHLIRNYYRFGWLIPFLFGSSPSLSPSFIKDPLKKQAFMELTDNKGYLPYATSLRLSDLGYTNDVQSSLGITFNELEVYVSRIKQAAKIRSERFAKIGIKIDDSYRQINDNILQIENEFYVPIRPKRVVVNGETPTDALLRGGVEYVEVRSLDVNPFTPVGITEEQVRFIDLFLIWCVLAPSPEMSCAELDCAKRNWTRVVMEGRKPNQVIGFGCDAVFQLLAEVGRALFADLFVIADILDKSKKNRGYRRACELFMPCFDNPELTLSGRTLSAIKELGSIEFGLTLAKQYQQQLLSGRLQVITETDFAKEKEISVIKQQEKEAADAINFDDFIKQFQ